MIQKMIIIQKMIMIQKMNMKKNLKMLFMRIKMKSSSLVNNPLLGDTFNHARKCSKETL